MPASFHAVLRVALVIAIITAGVAEEIHAHAASPAMVSMETSAAPNTSRLQMGRIILEDLRVEFRTRCPSYFSQMPRDRPPA
jgi:hypothetical protein